VCVCERERERDRQTDRHRKTDSYILTVFHAHTCTLLPSLLYVIAPLLMCVVVRASMNVNMREDVVHVELTGTK
jgi:hypothetical protein